MDRKVLGYLSCGEKVRYSLKYSASWTKSVEMLATYLVILQDELPVSLGLPTGQLLTANFPYV